MLVDDEKSYNELMTRLLTDALGCVVHGFVRPLDALAAIPSLDPAVIVTDYSMPDLNGIDFIRQATPLAPHAAFVLISGNNLSPESDRLATLTALKGFLAKPFGCSTLASEILRVWPADSKPQQPKADAATT